MFCASCGTEERQESQFCRACGSDMRTIRTALQKPDSITASAISARDEIGRAIAAKIQETKTTRDLKKIVEDVLPEIEKFLESPEQRRLRRLRAGVTTAAIGLGVMILLLIKTVPIAPVMILGWPAGLLVFLIGLGVVINGLLFTVPAKHVADRSLDAQAQSILEKLAIGNVNATSSLPPETNNNNRYLSPPPSVVEHTTRQLPNQGVPVKRITAEINE